MKQISDDRSILQELLAQTAQMLECDGITQVTKHNGVIQAVVDETIPVLIHFVPNQQTKEGEYVLQIYFTLSKIHTTKASLLLARLDELTPYLTLGSLCVLPGQEIGYKHRMPIKVGALSQAITNFKQSIQLMLLFLLTFLPYVQTLSKDPETITLAQYLAEEG